MRTDSMARARLSQSDVASMPASDSHKSTVDRALLVATSDPALACGVGDFTHRLRHELGATQELRIDGTVPRLIHLWHALKQSRGLVFNLPLVGWKRNFLRPLASILFARVLRVPITLMLHEWGSLHWLRRLTYWPMLIAARRIVMFSPRVRAELQGDTWLGWTSRKVRLAPLPPNLTRPARVRKTAVSHQLAAARQTGKLVVATFGSIYPGKQPEAMLEIAAALKAAGHTPLMVFIGSFVRATDQIEQIFWQRVDELGLKEDVVVTGFVETPEELFGIFEQVDAFVYRLSEGVTARRASILTAVQADSPVIVTAPESREEFDHHPRFRALIEEGKLILVRRDATAEDYATAIATANALPKEAAETSADVWWRDLTAAVQPLL